MIVFLLYHICRKNASLCLVIISLSEKVGFFSLNKYLVCPFLPFLERTSYWLSRFFPVYCLSARRVPPFTNDNDNLQSLLRAFDDPFKRSPLLVLEPALLNFIKEVFYEKTYKKNLTSFSSLLFAGDNGLSNRPSAYAPSFRQFFGKHFGKHFGRQFAKQLSG